MSYSSAGSSNYSIPTPKENQKVVYLTFDDGPEPGTREVYELLTSMEVPATFFLVGENATHYEQSNPGFLGKLYNDPRIQIGNHSQTQARQFYGSYYDKGLRINADTLTPDARSSSPAARRSVLMDFEYANVAFSGVLARSSLARPADYAQDYTGIMDPKKLNHGRFLAARLPGRNVWRLPKVKTQNWSARDAKDEADQLYDNSYKIYGWDVEWSMSFSVPEMQRNRYQQGQDGFIDLYSDENIDLDRPTETADDVFTKIKSSLDAWYVGAPQKKNKIILLMHERAFRDYKDTNPKLHLNKLRDFINKCIGEGYAFDVVENY